MSEPELHDLIPMELTRAAFAPYGTVVPPMEDGTAFGPLDATLRFGSGTPRFYAMRLPNRGLVISRITRHRQVTQVLASAGGLPWLIAVAPPPAVDADDAEPDWRDIRAFSIPGNAAVMLACGTWHAGPLFQAPEASFFNLELSDTNITDHWSCDLVKRYGVALRLAPENN
ncbi:MAG TPA: hypothetical protein DDZ81_16260 [Acetobacteraceae bacterium]|jgi:ureidoglycolate lyase|nr:hypothetical protein [Acetobacteraceae bacterium]